MSHLCPYCGNASACVGADFDPGVDWVGQVLHERWLADRDTRLMRELAPAERRARLNLRNARLGDQARTRGTQQLSFEC
jgi:hypothetical protein